MINFADRNLTILNITHCDLDGSVAGIVVKRFYVNTTTYVTNYNRVEETLTYLNIVKNNIDAVVFTDFSPKEYFEEFKALNIPFLVLDHHESALPINNPKEGIIINQKFCGAKLAYLYYVRYAPELKCLEELVNLADDYDMWHMKDPRSRYYNTLHWCYYGFDEFYERFKTGDITLNEWEKGELLKAKQCFKEVWDNLPLTDLPHKGCLVEVSTLLSEISIELEKLGYKYFIMYNPVTDKLHFRSRTDEINFVDITAKLGRGGGHRQAASCSCLPSELKPLVEKILSILDDVYKN